MITQRIHPNIAIHTQATGRHSTTGHPQKDGGFPLAQLPPDLHDIFEPDVGTFWVGGDFKGQEIWIMSAEANDLPTLEVLQRGEGSHTMALCDGMEWPYPTNRVDPKYDVAWLDALRLNQQSFKTWRNWMKRARLAMNYGKNPSYLYRIPGSKALGIHQTEGVEIATRYLKKHPALQAYWETLEHQIRTTRIVRSFSGRKRHLYAHGDQARREGYNAPMQCGGADILNLTIVRVITALPMVWYVYGVHDSFWFAVPEGACTVWELHDVVEQPFTINGHDLMIPIEWKPIRRSRV